MVPTELTGVGKSGRQTKDLPNTYSRSTAEIIMNPVGQNIPVICLHLESTLNNGAADIMVHMYCCIHGT